MQTYSVKNYAFRNLKWKALLMKCHGNIVIVLVVRHMQWVENKTIWCFFFYSVSTNTSESSSVEAVSQSSRCWTGDVFEVVGTSAPHVITEKKPVATSLWWAEAIYWLTMVIACVSTEFREMKPKSNTHSIHVEFHHKYQCVKVIAVRKSFRVCVIR